MFTANDEAVVGGQRQTSHKHRKCPMPRCATDGVKNMQFGNRRYVQPPQTLAFGIPQTAFA